MKKMTWWWARGAAVLLWLGGTSAVALPQLGGSEGDFLAWGAGARALALGKAYVALATDATAAYWNPAGLAFADHAGASALHAVLWEGSSYDFLGAAIPTVSSGTFGWFGSVLVSGPGERRDAENNPLSGGFGVTKFGTGVSYGMELQSGVSVGATVKWLGRWFDQRESGFFTTDLGVRVTPWPWASVGGVIQHLAAWRYGNTEDFLTPVARVGVALDPFPEVAKVVGDLEWDQRGGGVRWRLGMESAPVGPLTARVGLDMWEMAGGLGIAYEGVQVDYSGALHQDLGLSHRISVGIGWGESRLALRLVNAKAALDRALEAYSKAQAIGMREPAAQAYVEAARRALEEVLTVDPANVTAQRFLKNLLTGKFGNLGIGKSVP